MVVRTHVVAVFLEVLHVSMEIVLLFVRQVVVEEVGFVAAVAQLMVESADLLAEVILMCVVVEAVSAQMQIAAKWLLEVVPLEFGDVDIQVDQYVRPLHSPALLEVEQELVVMGRSSAPVKTHAILAVEVGLEAQAELQKQVKHVIVPINHNMLKLVVVKELNLTLIENIYNLCLQYGVLEACISRDV